MKAKSYLFTAASATLLLASCSQSEVVEMPASRAISFGTYVGNTTRAAAPETTEKFLQEAGNGFYVFGKYLDGTDERTVFDGTSDGSHVTWITSSWGYSPINYWLDGKTYKFAAYGPANVLNNGTASFDYETNSLKIENFKVVDGQTDLVAAAYLSAGKTPSADNTTETAIAFKFYHMLSKVKFTLVNGWRNDVTLNLAALKLNGVLAQATLTTETGMGNTGASAPKANIWSDFAEDKVSYSDTEYSSIENPWSSQKYSEAYEFELYLLPQPLTDNSDIKLNFTVSVVNKSGSGPDLDGDGPAQGGDAVTKTVIIPAETVNAWEPGKAYNYILTVDGEIFGLKPIQFDNITVEDWSDYVTDNLDHENIEQN